MTLDILIMQVRGVCFPVLGRLCPHRALLKTRLTGFSTPLKLPIIADKLCLSTYQKEVYSLRASTFPHEIIQLKSHMYLILFKIENIKYLNLF